MAKIYYVGDWAVLLGPSFAETPFQHAPKGLEIFNYGKWLKDALKSDFDGMPPILGYNETKTIPEGEVLVTIEETGHPLVVVRQIGQGHVLAYTSDPAPHWGLNFVYWEHYNRFWLKCLSLVLPESKK